MPRPRPSILLTVLFSAVLSPQLATAAFLRRSGLVKVTTSGAPRPNRPASDDNECSLYNKKFDSRADELATLVKSHSPKARVLIMGLDNYVRSAMDRLWRRSICFEKVIFELSDPEMAYLQCREGDAGQYSFIYFWYCPENVKSKCEWIYWGNGYDQPKNENLQKLVQLSGAKQTCHPEKSGPAPELPTTPFPPDPPITLWPTVEPPSTKEPIFTVEPIFPTASPFPTKDPPKPPTDEPIFTVKPIFPTASPFPTKDPPKPPTDEPIYMTKPIYPTESPLPTQPGYPTAGPVPSPPVEQPRNIYGDALEPCQMGVDDGGSWDAMGQCTAVDSTSDAHNLCINTLPWGFSAVLGEGPWSKERHSMRHCATVAQWSRYLYRESKMHNTDEIKTIYPFCQAVPEEVLYQKNAAAWKGTGSDPGDLRLGVSEFVKKCLRMAKSPEEKCGLFWRAYALTKTTALESSDLINEAKKWMGHKMACPELQAMSLSSVTGMGDVNETYHSA